MPVQSRDIAQVHGLQHHLDAAVALPPRDVDRLRELARQLDRRPVMPIIGAGGSYDCGMRLARDLAQDLHAEYMADARYKPRPSNWNSKEFKSNLGAVADAMALKCEQDDVVKALGLDNPALWPGADDLTGHFCAYRVLSRLAREELFAEALTFNYDCGFEAGLHDEGFLFSPRTLRGREWNDHATVVADATTNAELQRRGAFVLIKAHGCAARYRQAKNAGHPAKPEDAIILRWSQLLDWRRDLWARDVFRERARRHVLLLLGFSGQDPVIHVSLTRVLEDVYQSALGGHPRVVVVGHHPDTLTLRMLVKVGCGEATPPPGAITHISTRNGTTTAIALVLLTELLALRLDPILDNHGVALPGSLEPRLATLAVAAPTMLRWSFLLRRPSPWRDYAQRINLEQAAERGYVPLMADPHTTALSLGTRTRLRARLGLPGNERTAEAIANDGFIVKRGLGRAFLPVGLSQVELVQAAGHGGELEQARRALPRPGGLDCVLVSRGSDEGVSIETGAEVPVP